MKIRAFFVAAPLVAGVAAIAFLLGRTTAPTQEAANRVRATPGVVLAIHDVARLETTVFHIEKIVEADDAQSRLWGVFHPKDTLLLVAVGDVVAGVDLTKVRDSDVHGDATARTIRVTLPAPEIVASTLDEKATHVYQRTTDMLAKRNEQLEGEARHVAEDEMRKAALEEGIIDRARTGAERAVGSLLRQLGYEKVEVDWTDRS